MLYGIYKGYVELQRLGLLKNAAMIGTGETVPPLSKLLSVVP